MIDLSISFLITPQHLVSLHLTGQVLIDANLLAECRLILLKMININLRELMENFQEKKQELELKRDLDAKQQKELAEKKQELEQCGKLLGDILSLLRSKQVVSFNRVFTDYR